MSHLKSPKKKQAMIFMIFHASPFGGSLISRFRGEGDSLTLTPKVVDAVDVSTPKVLG